MTKILFKSEQPLALFGGGDVSQADVALARETCRNVIACDGGANVLRAFDLIPDLVLGDLDSLSDATRAALSPDSIIEIKDQDTTDFEKALLRVEAPLLVGFGFLGRRVDHQLAAFSALVRAQHQRCILVSEHDVCVHVPSVITLSLPVGTRLSLFPMGEVEGRSEGLKWSIDGIKFAPNGRIGTSNETIAPQVRLQFSESEMLLILPRSAFAALIDALTSPQPASARATITSHSQV